MGFDFKIIKNLFVVEDEKTTEQKQQETQDTKVVSNTKIPVNTAETNKTTSTGASGSGSMDEKILDSLIKSLETNNLPGEDYLEFIQALDAMKNLQLEETIKLQTVLATLSTRGLNKQKLLESGQFYLTILEAEKKKFYDAFTKQVENQVGGKQKEIEKIDSENKAKAEQIAKLTDEINGNQKKIGDLKKQIEETNGKIKTTENNFVFTYNVVVSQINSNLNKLKTI